MAHLLRFCTVAGISAPPAEMLPPQSSFPWNSRLRSTRLLWQFVIASLVLLLFSTGPLTAAEKLPGVTHYHLRLKILPADQRLDAMAEMVIVNSSSQAVSELPFLLYRLLDVRDVLSENGKPLAFSQSVVKFEDEPTLQVNSIKVILPKPLPPEATTRLTMRYAGAVLGYAEVMAYVRDRIDEQYSLLRQDSYAYPVLAHPSFASVFAAGENTFTYQIETSVPKGYVAACGGDALQQRESGSSILFDCFSRQANSRMDIAVAPFKVFDDSKASLRVYALPEDESAAANILAEMKRVISFYQASFGEIGISGYTAIEIPDGWGSQAATGYFLQSAAAFRDPKKISELYHEIGHRWNAKAATHLQRCRWFDEAFASYFAALAVRQFQGEPAFQEEMEHARNTFLAHVAKDPRVASTPIVEYGRIEIGENSYTKGAWSLYVLHELIGTPQFNKTVGNLLREFHDKPADFSDFVRIAEQVSGRSLQKYAQEWLYGTESSQLLSGKQPIGVIVARYR